MLINLTTNNKEIERREQVAKDNRFKYTPQAHTKWLQEIGIYQERCSFNFPKAEFNETIEEYDYGVADSIEQIKDNFKEEVRDSKRKYVISVSPVYQDKENEGKGGGWRWHKWGEYIGKLNPQYEYLDDEDFGEDFKYIIVYSIYKIIN